MDVLLSGGKLIEHVTVEAFLTSVLLLEILALLSVPSVLLRRRGRPLSALAWLLALIALPVVGFLAWWAFGRTRIDRRLRRHVLRKKAYLERHGAPSTDPRTRFDHMLPERARGEYAFTTRGNSVELLTDGPNAFPEMERAIEEATECIHLLFYIFRLDETGTRLCRRLIDKAREGVRVRVLVDGFGSQATATRLRKLLTPEGVEFSVFLPSRISPLHSPRLNFINHRKILVVDNAIAFSGGMNIGKEYETSWRDLMLKIRGPAVSGLNHVFLEDWYFSSKKAIADPARAQRDESEEGCDVAVVSSGPDTEPWIHDAYFMAITRAERRLWIVTPYFIPTSPILAALRTAAGRGVDVRLVVPNLSDVKVVSWASRSYYQLLVAVGVRIYEYKGAMLHAKAMVVDDVYSIGTANIDNRSMRLNFEVCTFIDHLEMTERLVDWMVELMQKSVELSEEDLKRVSKLQSLGESIAHLMSPLL